MPLFQPAGFRATQDMVAPCTSMAAKECSGRRPRRHVQLLMLSLPCVLVCFAMMGRDFASFVIAQGSKAHDRRSQSAVQLHAGKIVTDDIDMLDQLKQWKKNRQAKGGFGDSPKPEPAPAPAPAPVAETPAPPAVNQLSAQHAVSELLALAQKEADPSTLSPQQLIAVFFAFFKGYRQRHGIGGEIELNSKHKQMVVLLIQGTLGTIQSARDFWPMVCGQLSDERDPDMRELMSVLTGLVIKR